MNRDKTSPEYTVKRLSKVIIRTIHLVGVAGLFGHAMMGNFESVYMTLTILSGILLAVMEASSGLIWFVQIRGLALFLKLLLLLPIHFVPQTAVASMIAVIIISGFVSHAPGWIRYFSLWHWKVIHSPDDIPG